jgi:hypothetical protein
MRKLLLIAILLFPTSASADEWFSWDDMNTKLHVPLTATFIIDLGQTLWAHDNKWSPGGYKESNKILGPYPSRKRIYTHFIASYLLTSFAVWALPEKYSHAFQAGVIALEMHHINKNLSLNIGFKF